MSRINKKRLYRVWFVFFLVLVFANLALFIRWQLQGSNVALLNPKGLIAHEQFDLMVYSTAIMLVIAVPTIFLLYFFAWKYRETNNKATYHPGMRHGKWFNFSVWAIPTVFMLVLAFLMIPATHKLDPRKAIAADSKPLTIQVISMRWKWLFLYPEQKIATVNFVQVPLNTPVRFELTADESPMSSFWIPNLGGQLYAMTGHVNRLNLMATTVGDYPGSSAEITGVGFSGMKFTARASSNENFDEWVQQVKRSSSVLDAQTYANVLQPSKNNPVVFYSGFEPSLYAKVVMKYTGVAGGHNHH